MVEGCSWWHICFDLMYTLFYITGCNKFTAHQNAVTVEGEIFLKSGNGILPEQCKAACVAQTAFFCTAAVMRRHGACYLTGYKPKGHFMSTHFYRMCKGSAFILFYFLLYFPDKELLITVRNSSSGKIMFSQVSVCPQGEGVHPTGRHTPLLDRHPTGRQTPPWVNTPLDRQLPPPRWLL